ncbi:TlpA disulfide reductase family protein [Sphingobacterium bovistauri]|uniref:AhpC/TSA family protein n=1 Tax=Sphingobacterium bovistauri TaxID=2781959 RepID=A0ABS7Z5W9_9SPHI|nr:TlpA disulfide reductase family protein [Sphingobacterium bovistauri]MCA5005542.1 AhpC/TSA family protein [Sphingobacterium bovistauri]
MNIKNQVWGLMLFLSPLSALGQGGQTQIVGKLPQRYNTQKIYLNYSLDNKLLRDSVIVQKGSFEFKVAIAEPLTAEIRLGDMQQMEWLSVLLKPGKITVDSKDSLHNAIVKGDSDVLAYQKLAKIIKENSYRSTMAYFKGFSIKDMEKQKQYFVKATEDVRTAKEKNNKSVFQFITENPNSIVSLLTFKNYPLGDNLIQNAEKIAYFEKLNPSLRESVLGKKVENVLIQAKGLSVLTNYIDFTSTTPEGNQLRMLDVLAKHKYILLDFWASWCGPCRKENPNVVKAFNAYKDKGFSVMSVSLDQDRAKWLEAIETDGMPWYHVSSLKYWDEPVAKLYNVRGIPQNVLLDNKGKVVAINLKGQKLYDFVGKLYQSSNN